MAEKKYLTIRIDEHDERPHVVVDGTDIEIAGLMGVSYHYNGENGRATCDVHVLAFNGEMLNAVRHDPEPKGRP